MKHLLILLLSGIATPSLAQHAGLTAPTPAPAAGSCTPEHAAMGHCKLPEEEPAATSTCTPEHAAMGHCKLPEPATAPPQKTATPSSACTAEHAAMGHCKLPEEEPAPTSTCTPEHAAMGHCTLPDPPQPTPAVSVDPNCPPEHAAMGHCTPSAAPTAEVPVGPPTAKAMVGPKHAADTVWGREGMQRGRTILGKEHGAMTAHKLLVDRAETRVRNGRDGYLLDLQAWYGGDIDKLWLKSEVEGDWGRKAEHAEVQALWSHAIDPWFDLQVGVRQDLQTGPRRTYLVAGIQGLAPYWWEVDGAVFLSNKGEVTARTEAEYDLRITQKLILQPRAEASISLQNVPELGMGSGLTEASLGMRLRYQLSPLVAPYIGVEYERAFGDTRDYRRAEGEDPDGVSLLAGFRFWF